MNEQNTESWQTIGFKTGKSIHVVEDNKNGNILCATYIDGGEYLTKDEIEEELF
jgi:hypothetical protein